MTPAKIRAAIALGLVLGAVAFGFVPLLWLGMAQGFSGFDAYLPRVVSFTLQQAFLSTVISLLIALPVARAIARRNFWGRDVLLKLFFLPLALPAIVAILGIIGVASGVVSIYGLHGIIFAHVFFNMPLAVRLMLTRLDAIPAENFRLAAQLNFSDRDVFDKIEWPQLASAMTGVASLIFLLCTASFAVVLILGGGPQATTLEVAIYQSLRLDFDPARASVLALAQFVLCGILVLLAGRFATEGEVVPRTVATTVRYDGKSLSSQVMDCLAIAVAALIVLPPLLSIVVSGLWKIQFTETLLRAAGTSLFIGFSAACVSLLLGWTLADAAARQQLGVVRPVIMLASLAALIMPPAVLATGWFVALSQFADVGAYAIVLVVWLNALMALPFIWSPLYPAIIDANQRHDRLCASLGLTGWPRLKRIDFPALHRPLGLAFLMGMIVSLGDLSAIVLFGSDKLVTLPALIYRQMGSYRMEAAAGTALVLALLCFGLTSLAQRWSASRDQA